MTLEMHCAEQLPSSVMMANWKTGEKRNPENSLLPLQEWRDRGVPLSNLMEIS